MAFIRRGMILVLLGCAFSSHENKEKHYLIYKFTGLSGTDLFPEFSIETVVDETPISQYSADWTKHLARPPDSREWFLHHMRTLSNCTHTHCSELHVFQRIMGCEVEKSANGAVMNIAAFDEYGFDGEDLMTFNFDTVKWVVENPKAKEIKTQWDLQTDRNLFIKVYLQNCMDWISKFNNTRMSEPNVYIFARKAPDDQHKLILICLVTDFFPREVEVNIRLNKSVLEDVTSSETRPTPDGSFQLKASVKIDRSQEEFYECYVIHSSLMKPLSILWDGGVADHEESTLSVTIKVAIVLGVTVAVLFFIFWILDKVKRLQWRIELL